MLGRSNQIQDRPRCIAQAALGSPKDKQDAVAIAEVENNIEDIKYQQGQDVP